VQSYVNRRELRVIGMSRSGNHAIINWILRQSVGHSCHLNCAEGKTNPFLSARPLHSGLCYETNAREFDWAEEQAGRFTQKDLLIHSYEDSFLGYVCHPIFEQHHDEWVGRSLQRHDLLILRDPFNLFASRQRAGALLEGVAPATALRIWKQHAREYLGETRYLKQPKILVNYNRWATERVYRAQLAAQLGLTFTDAGVNSVAGTAGGSSFDGARFDGSAHNMKVLERWKVYQNDLTYRQRLQADWLDYTARIFGPLPGVEALFVGASNCNVVAR
jgi:hypothetical protein